MSLSPRSGDNGTSAGGSLVLSVVEILRGVYTEQSERAQDDILEIACSEPLNHPVDGSLYHSLSYPCQEERRAACFSRGRRAAAGGKGLGKGSVLHYKEQEKEQG